MNYRSGCYSYVGCTVTNIIKVTKKKYMKKISFLTFLFYLVVSCSIVQDETELNNHTYNFEIVINASKDGGAWWSPQSINCDTAEAHQGKVLVDLLKQEGYSVYESCREEYIDIDDFPNIKLLIVAGSYLKYSDTESEMIYDYVRKGGKLMLLLDHSPDNSLASKFGLDFQKPNENNGKLIFENHEITSNIDIEYAFNISGFSGLNSSVLDYDVIARMDEETFLDLNYNGFHDHDEICAPTLIGTMNLEKGKMIFSGDVNIWQNYTKLFMNTIEWFDL